MQILCLPFPYTFVLGFLQGYHVGGEGVVLLHPPIHQLLHLLHLFRCHAARQIKVKA